MQAADRGDHGRHVERVTTPSISTVTFIESAPVRANGADWRFDVRCADAGAMVRGSCSVLQDPRHVDRRDVVVTMSTTAARGRRTLVPVPQRFLWVLMREVPVPQWFPHSLFSKMP